MKTRAADFSANLSPLREGGNGTIVPGPIRGSVRDHAEGAGSPTWLDDAYPRPVDIGIQCSVIDAADCERLARFWSEALGWRITHESAEEWVIEPPEGSPPVDVAPDILFVKVPEAKTVKNRLHLDLRPVDRDAQVKRLIDLGARRVNIGQPDDVTWVVMVDPEGNEFCVLAPLPAAAT